MTENRSAAISGFLHRAEEEIAHLLADDKSLDISHKQHAGDLVTNVDLRISALAQEYLQAHFPGELLLSEESGESHQLLQDPDFSGWVIDPIDGTNNFARGIKYWAVSLAWIENGRPDVGGVLTAEGQVLLSDQVPRGTSSAESLGPGTRVATSNNLDYQETLNSLDRYHQLPGVWVDCLGSAVSIFADLANGRIDLFQHKGLKPWDNPAGFLLVEQAGGVVVDFSGQRADWRGNEVIAGPTALVEEFLQRMI